MVVCSLFIFFRSQADKIFWLYNLSQPTNGEHRGFYEAINQLPLHCQTDTQATEEKPSLILCEGTLQSQCHPPVGEYHHLFVSECSNTYTIHLSTINMSVSVS